MARRPILFVDMEGTLFQKTVPMPSGNSAPSAWTAIAQALGPECSECERRGHEGWNAGEFSGYLVWAEHTLQLFKRHGLTKGLFDKILGGIDYYPGVKEVFQFIQDKYTTVLISGGFKAQADRAQQELRLTHTIACCELFWDEAGFIQHWNLLPCDYEGKADMMKLMVREYGQNPDRCAFIGDGPNDRLLAKLVGNSIAFNASQLLQEVATHVINQPEGQEDFRAVLEFL